MIIEGQNKFNVDIQTLWESLHDETVLKNVIPGCQELTLNGDGEYDVVLKLGVAAVKGEYIGQVKLEDKEVPHYYVLHAKGSGGPGHVDAKMDCRLTETDGGCILDWKCDAVVGGMIASVGNRVLVGVAKFLAGKFFKDIQKELKTSV